MRLAKLTGLEIEKLEAELKEVRATIKELKGILASKPRRMSDPEGGDAGDRQELRRRPPHRDPRRPGRLLGRGSDRRRGHGHHHLPHRLHQADLDLHLQAAAPRRAGPPGRDDQGRGLDRAPLHRQHPRLPDVLHQHRAGLLAQGARNPAGRPCQPGEAGGELHRHQARRTDCRDGGGAGIRRRQVAHVRHPAGHGEEDRALRLRQRAHERHQRDQHRGGRRADRRAALRRGQRYRARHRGRDEHPVPPGRRPGDGPSRRPA